MSRAVWLRLAFAVSALLAVGFSAAADVPDEAGQADHAAVRLLAVPGNFCHDTDDGAALTVQGLRGRATWPVWLSGGGRFWEDMPRSTLLAFRPPKVVAYLPDRKSHQGPCDGSFKAGNEPYVSQAKGPRLDRFSLWLNRCGMDCPAASYTDAGLYPGLAIGVRSPAPPVNLLADLWSQTEPRSVPRIQGLRRAAALIVPCIPDASGAARELAAPGTLSLGTWTGTGAA